MHALVKLSKGKAILKHLLLTESLNNLCSTVETLWKVLVKGFKELEMAADL